MKILAPHKEQDGWVYVRVLRTAESDDFKGHPAARFSPLKAISYATPGFMPCERCHRPTGAHTLPNSVYVDSFDPCRIISSRRVEEAVETADFLRLCAEEGLVAQYGDAGLAGSYVNCWVVRYPLSFSGGGLYFTGATLREAYYRMVNSKYYPMRAVTR